jgi:hypothetical protein
MQCKLFCVLLYWIRYFPMYSPYIPTKTFYNEWKNVQSIIFVLSIFHFSLLIPSRYLIEDHLLMIIVGFQKVIYIHFTIYLFSYSNNTLLHWYTTRAHIEQQQPARGRYMTRRVHYVQFTHRSWFPLTWNKNYIKSYSWGEWERCEWERATRVHIYMKNCY